MDLKNNENKRNWDAIMMGVFLLVLVSMVLVAFGFKQKNINHQITATANTACSSYGGYVGKYSETNNNDVYFVSCKNDRVLSININ